MEDFVAQVLEKMKGDMTHLGDAFDAKLSLRDELMLTKIEQEMGLCVEGIMDLALAGADCGGEVSMSQWQRDRVMELTAIQKMIHALIRERGSFAQWREGLN
jgi:hypothetical protein